MHLTFRFRQTVRISEQSLPDSVCESVQPSPVIT